MTIKQRMMLLMIRHTIDGMQFHPHGYIRGYMVSDVRKLVAELRHNLLGNK